MLSLQYKNRIHKAKFSGRSLQYIFCDQAARALPWLQKRWLFPVESIPIAKAASSNISLTSIVLQKPIPEQLQALGWSYEAPFSVRHHHYGIENVIVTGWAGAMMKDGLLLTIRPKHNWVSGLRARPHTLRALNDERPYFNLMCPIPARGHIFHWLYDSVMPLFAYLENGGSASELGLLVNGNRSQIQNYTLQFLTDHYGIRHVEALQENQAAHVPNLIAGVPETYTYRALQTRAALAKLDDFTQFFTGRTSAKPPSKRIYISRNDAKLRRVLNEDALLPLLERYGFHRVVLKGMAMPDQVRLFHEAEAVIAPHGAGLAHTTWCRSGTKILEFFPDPTGPRGRVRNATANFFLISQMRGLEYHSAFAGPLLDRNDGFEIPENTLAQLLHNKGALP